MNVRLLFLPSLLLAAGSVSAEVSICQLQPTEEHIKPSLSVYSFEGEIHSAFLEFTTDYGDVLPYLFVCHSKECETIADDKDRLACYDLKAEDTVSCRMILEGDDYSYTLVVEPELRNPETITLLTESISDDYRSVETLMVESCQGRRH